MPTVTRAALELPVTPPTPMQRVLWREVLHRRAPHVPVDRIDEIELHVHRASGNVAGYLTCVHALTAEQLGDAAPVADLVARSRDMDAVLVKGASTDTGRAPRPWDDPTIPYDAGSHRELRCNNCRSDQVEVTFRQVRSADEGMTCFAVCQGCRSEWKL